MRLFKNILIYEFDEPFSINAEDLNEMLSEYPLKECLAQEMESYGWRPAFANGNEEVYVEAVNQAYFIRLGIEQKRLPKLAIKTAVEKRARDLNINIGSRAQYREIEDVILNELVPNALPEQSSMLAYIDTVKQWLVVDASNVKKASLLTSLLRKTLGSLSVSGYAPQVALSMVMTDWVVNRLPSDELAFLDEIELKEIKEEGGIARYKGISLESKEIIQNLEQNWQVTRLGMLYKEQVSFSFGEDSIVKRLRYLDTFQETIDDSEDLYQISLSNAFLQVETFRDLVGQLHKMCYE